MAENKTKPTDVSPQNYLESFEDNPRALEAQILIDLITAVTKAPATMWGTGIIGRCNIFIWKWRRLRTVHVRFNLLWRSTNWVYGSRRTVATCAYLAAGGALLWSSYIHYHLGHDLRRGVSPTTRSILVLQSLTGLAVSLAMVMKRQVWTALATAAFCLSTLLGFLIAVDFGLLGPRTSWNALDSRSAVISEVLATAFSLFAALITIRGSRTRRGLSRPSATMPSHL